MTPKPIHPLARLTTFGIAKRTQVLIQDSCSRRVVRQGAVRRQGVQTGFKTGVSRKTDGTRQGGCRITDPLSCAKTGAVVKTKTAKTQAHNATTCIFRLISPSWLHINPKTMHRCGVWSAKNVLRRGGRCRPHPVWPDLTGSYEGTTPGRCRTLCEGGDYAGDTCRDDARSS